MDRAELPTLSFEQGGELSEAQVVYDRDNSLIVIALSRENDYSGEFVNIGRVCIALGEKMDAVDVQVQYSPGDAKTVPGLRLPEGLAARLIFAESYLQVEDVCGIEAHPEMSVMHFYFTDPKDELLHLSLAKNVVFDVTPDDRLAGIWVSGVTQR